jgi:DNA polymerase-3 subunit delta'
MPKAMVRGDTAYFKDWTIAQTVDALQKLCHDAMAHVSGAQPRFFQASDFLHTSSLSKLTQWSRSLATTRQTMDHPFNAGLMQEALVAQAKIALNS